MWDEICTGVVWHAACASAGKVQVSASTALCDCKAGSKVESLCMQEKARQVRNSVARARVVTDLCEVVTVGMRSKCMERAPPKYFLAAVGKSCGIPKLVTLLLLCTTA